MKDNIFPDVATELDEIFKYIDEEILIKIPSDIKEHIKNTKNVNYNFKLDKNKELLDQDLLQETKQILSVLFLKYCCSETEVDEILQKHSQLQMEIEDEKIGLEELQNVFKSNLNYNANLNESKEITIIEETSWYSRFLDKIKKFFKIKK